MSTDRSGERFEAEYRFLRDDGEVVWVRDTAVLVERDGAWPVWQGVIEDITARRQTEIAPPRGGRTIPGARGADPRPHLHRGTGLGRAPVHEPADRGDARLQRGRVHERPDALARTDPPRRSRPGVGLECRRRHRRVGRGISDVRARTAGPSGCTTRPSSSATTRAMPRFWLGVIVDTTERMEAEERLRLAQDRYRYLVERLPTTVYVDAADDLSTALYISPQYEALTGYSPEERLSDPGLWLHMLHAEDRDQVLAESTPHERHRGSVRRRVPDRDQGRADRVAPRSRVPRRWARRAARAGKGVLTDITERKLAEEAISRRDEILQAVGHAAERFLGASSWTDAIRDVLAHLGRAGDASRAAVSTGASWTTTVGTASSLVEEWTAPGVEALAEQIGDRLVVFDDIGLSRWSEVFASGELINSLTVDLPESERATLEHADVQTIVAIPIVSGGEWWGHLVYDQIQQARVWQQAEVDALRVVANTLGAAVGPREGGSDPLRDGGALPDAASSRFPPITYIDECHDVTDARVWPNVYISPQVADDPRLLPRGMARRPRAVGEVDPSGRSRELARRPTDAIASRVSRSPWRSGSWPRTVRSTGSAMRRSSCETRPARPLWSQGILLDITERRSPRRGTSTRPRRDTETLIETMPAATYIDTSMPSRNRVYVSPQMEQMYGYTPEEWKSRPAALGARCCIPTTTIVSSPP